MSQPPKPSEVIQRGLDFLTDESKWLRDGTYYDIIGRACAVGSMFDAQRSNISEAVDIRQTYLEPAMRQLFPQYADPEEFGFYQFNDLLAQDISEIRDVMELGKKMAEQVGQ